MHRKEREVSEKTTGWLKHLKWKSVLFTPQPRRLICTYTLLLSCPSSSDHTIPPHTHISVSCLSISPSLLLSNISPLCHPSGRTISHPTNQTLSFLSLFSLSPLGGCLPFSKSGAAFCIPAGSKALTNGRSAHQLTSNRTNWHCKSPWKRKLRHDVPG